MNNFEISYAAESDVSTERLVVGNRLVDLMNEHLKLSDYTEKFKTLLVVYQCFAPDNEYITAEEFVRHRRKTDVLELHLLMDYEKTKSASETEMKQIFANVYRAAIQKHLMRKDFDGERFAADFERVGEEYFTE